MIQRKTAVLRCLLLFPQPPIILLCLLIPICLLIQYNVHRANSQPSKKEKCIPIYLNFIQAKQKIENCAIFVVCSLQTINILSTNMGGYKLCVNLFICLHNPSFPRLIVAFFAIFLHLIYMLFLATKKQFFTKKILPKILNSTR